MVQASQASTATLSTDDFDQAGSINNPTEGIDVSERKDLTNIVTAKYLAFKLNTNGRSWVSKTGATKLGLREGHDVVDSAFTSLSATETRYNYLAISSGEYAGTAQDPYLTVTYTQPATTATTTTVANAVIYQYDEAGQRTKKTENGKVSIYPNKLYTIEDGKVKKHIFAGDNSVATIDDGKIIYHHPDHLSGSSVESDKDGFAVEVLDYYPFGSIRTDTKLTAYENDKKFTGYELDASGLYYAGQRYYNSEIGRFVGQDPAHLLLGGILFESRYGRNLKTHLANPQSLNSYSYVNNNPLKYTDPDGEIIETISDIGFTTYDFGKTFYRGGQFVGSLFSGDLQKASNASQAFLGTFVDLGFDGAATLVPFVPAGLTRLDDGAKLVNKAKQFDAVAQQQKMLKGFENSRAINALKDTFKTTDTIPGGTMGAIRQEILSGNPTRGVSHAEGKAQNSINRINNIFHDLGNKLNPTEASRLQGIKNSLESLSKQFKK